MKSTFELRLHVVFGAELFEAKDAGCPLADAARGIAAQLRMHAGVEQRPPLGMLDEVRRDRQLDRPVLTFDHVLQSADKAAAGHRIELHGHATKLAQPQFGTDGGWPRFPRREGDHRHSRNTGLGAAR
jgi:hypothetical protein